MKWIKMIYYVWHAVLQTDGYKCDVMLMHYFVYCKQLTGKYTSIDYLLIDKPVYDSQLKVRYIIKIAQFFVWIYWTKVSFDKHHFCQFKNIYIVLCFVHYNTSFCSWVYAADCHCTKITTKCFIWYENNRLKLSNC